MSFERWSPTDGREDEVPSELFGNTFFTTNVSYPVNIRVLTQRVYFCSYRPREIDEPLQGLSVPSDIFLFYFLCNTSISQTSLR